MQPHHAATAVPAADSATQPKAIQPTFVPLHGADGMEQDHQASEHPRHMGGNADMGNAASDSTLQHRASSLPSISLLSLHDGGRGSPPRVRPPMSPSHSSGSMGRRASHHHHSHERHCSRLDEIKDGDDDNFMADAVVPDMLPEDAIPYHDQTPPEDTAAIVLDSPERTSPVPMAIPGLKKRTSWVSPNNGLGIPHSPRGSMSYPHSCSPLTTCMPLTPDAGDNASAPENATQNGNQADKCDHCPDDIQTFMDSPHGHYHGPRDAAVKSTSVPVTTQQQA